MHQDTDVQGVTEQRRGVQTEKRVHIGRASGKAVGAVPTGRTWGHMDHTGRGQPRVPDGLHSPWHSKTRRPPGPAGCS